MRKFINTAWKIITFPFIWVFKIVSYPFRLLWRIISFPFVLLIRFRKFLNTEPEEHPFTEVVSGIVTNASMRSFLMNEIETFRMHLLRAVLGVVVGVGISFYFTQQLMEFLARPIGGLGALQAIDPTESIGVYMRVALLSGIIIALPYIAFELWLFAAPGLRSREKKIGLFGIPLASIFFIGGVVFTDLILLPGALSFLRNFMTVRTQLRPETYFSFVTGLMFWIGVTFELPLLIYLLTAIGFIKPKVLVDQWRLAVVIIAILAAAITPTTDPVNMALVMLPVTLLYFISIGFSYVAYAGRTKNKEKLIAKSDMENSHPKQPSN
jgi:sec-independent protein translocase protein TatC